MLYTIAVVLVVLWLLGMVTSYTMGGLIHILIVIAVIVVLVNIIGEADSLAKGSLILRFKITTTR